MRREDEARRAGAAHRAPPRRGARRSSGRRGPAAGRRRPAAGARRSSGLACGPGADRWWPAARSGGAAARRPSLGRERGRRRATRRMLRASAGRPRRSPSISSGESARNSPGLEAARGDGPDRHAPQLRHRVPDRLEQPLHLVLLALVERHLHPGVVVGVDHARAVDRHEVAVDLDALLQALERLRVGDAVHLGVVDARHLVARVRHALGEGAVVGQQDQALGRDVEPAHREQPRHGRHQVHHGLPPLGVVARGDDAARLVQHQVDVPLRRLDANAVDADVVRARGRPWCRARARARRSS